MAKKTKAKKAAPKKAKAAPAKKKAKAAFKEKTIATPFGGLVSRQENKKHVFTSDVSGDLSLPLKDIRALHRTLGSELKRIDRYNGKA